MGNCSYCKVILKISQPKGSKCGCTFEPFGFIKAVGAGRKQWILSFLTEEQKMFQNTVRDFALRMKLPFTTEAAMAKVFASEVAMAATTKAI